MESSRDSKKPVPPPLPERYGAGLKELAAILRTHSEDKLADGTVLNKDEVPVDKGAIWDIKTVSEKNNLEVEEFTNKFVEYFKQSQPRSPDAAKPPETPGRSEKSRAEMEFSHLFKINPDFMMGVLAKLGYTISQHMSNTEVNDQSVRYQFHPWNMQLKPEKALNWQLEYYKQMASVKAGTKNLEYLQTMLRDLHDKKGDINKDNFRAFANHCAAYIANEPDEKNGKLALLQLFANYTDEMNALVRMMSLDNNRYGKGLNPQQIGSLNNTPTMVAPVIIKQYAENNGLIDKPPAPKSPESTEPPPDLTANSGKPSGWKLPTLPTLSTIIPTIRRRPN